MKPDVPLALGELANRLRTDLLAELTGFRANVAAMGAAMLDMVAQEWDGAAARLVHENGQFRALIDRGAALYGGAAAGGDDADLRISALTSENDRLRGLITDLMARLEEDSAVPAQALLGDIWTVLAESVAGRRIASTNF